MVVKILTTHFLRRTKLLLMISLLVTILIGCWQYYLYQYVSSIEDTELKKLRDYAIKHGYNDRYYVLVKFSEHSGRNRFFVYDDLRKEIIIKGLCSHGQGKGNTPSKPQFCNSVGSECSSLGKYAILNKHRMTTGYCSYVLKGLDKTNSNAQIRGILIHPSKMVSAFMYGIYPFYMPLSGISAGCFTISKNTFHKLSTIIEQENTPILLWAYF